VNNSVHVLHLEDDLADAELVQAMLESAGMVCRITRTQTCDEFDKALSEDLYDVILADYRLPGYDGVSALRLARERCADVPFIFVSGTMGEDAVIEGLTEGATDYVLKQKLSRLVPAVKRALQEAENLRERKRMENVLRESEERFRTLAEKSLVGVYIIQDALFRYVNPAFARIFSYVPDDIIDRLGPADFLTPEDRERVLDSIRRRTIGETEYDHLEFNVRRKDGVIRAVEAFGSHALHLGRPAVLGTLMDITERKRSEEALFQATRRWERTFDAVPDLIAILDKESRIVQANKAMASRLKCRPEECVGLACYKVVHETDGPPSFCPYVRTLRDHQQHMSEVSEERLGGEFLVSTSPIYDTEGKMVGSVHVARDITEQKRAEEERRRLEIQLHQAQKMEAIGTLAGGIAHDFNNLLTVLTGYGTLLMMRMDKANPLRTYVEQMLSVSEKAATLTQGLLAFSRQQPIHPNPLWINDIIKGTEKLLKRLITEDITLKIILAPDDIVIMADATQIDQILFNLATNARDAMQKGGILTIETRLIEFDTEFVHSHGFGKPGKYALLSISDTGTGIDETIKATIFDPFFTTKEVGKGTGLGLSTVYGIVTQHNGYISVYSEPNLGTTFHIYLPATTATVKEEQPPLSLVKRGRETILVAEDNEGVRRLIKEVLTEYGYTIIEATDGEEAVDKFKKESKIDLLILDSVMPKKGGREAYDEINKIKPGVNVLFTSGYTRDVILQKGLEEGEFDLMTKPLSPKRLLEKIREILDRGD
jgi:two-component system cell cycle sensor histidine kinase/response regulator CckA